MKPTEEQLRAVDLFKSGKNLKISAFAGAGKTSTLILLSAGSSKPGLYLAFNKKIADEAASKFPKLVNCRTTHSLAFRAVKDSYRSTNKLTQALFPNQLAAAFSYQKRSFGSVLALSPAQQGFLVLKTVSAFCQSADEELAIQHMPMLGVLIGQRKSVLDEVRNWVLEESTKLWSCMTNVQSDLPLGHDGYLKVWALGKPVFPASYIFLDEAQDSNPVVLDVLRNQSAQIVYVGDRHQQIYEWRGAVNAMEKIKTDEAAYLTKSFRFGATIADRASQVLRTLGEERAISGNETVESSIESAGHASVVLARTNATVISEVVEALDEGGKPFIVGGAEELKRLVSDVYELKKGQPARSPEFFGFQNWLEVVSFSKTEEGESLQRFVQLVEKHGEGGLWRAVTSTAANEDAADRIVSTAHKAKGCEWDSVRLASDFVSTSPKAERGLSEAEVRLFYVAMTRAKVRLVVDDAVLNTFASGAWKTIGKSPNRDLVSGASTESAPSSRKSPPTEAPLAAKVKPPRAIAVSPRTNRANLASTPTSIERPAIRGGVKGGPEIKKVSIKRSRTEPPSLLKRITKFLGL